MRSNSRRLPSWQHAAFGPGARRSRQWPAQSLIGAGRNWVVDIDLEKFFDRVNHYRLMARIAKAIADKRVLKLTRRFLNEACWRTGWSR